MCVINFGQGNCNNDGYVEGLAGKEISKEEGVMRLIPSSSTMLAGWFCEQTQLYTELQTVRRVFSVLVSDDCALVTLTTVSVG